MPISLMLFYINMAFNRTCYYHRLSVINLFLSTILKFFKILIYPILNNRYGECDSLSGLFAKWDEVSDNSNTFLSALRCCQQS